MSLLDYYKSLNITMLEGYSQQVEGQVALLKRLINEPGIKNVMEIGFNAGHSAEIFLSSNSDISLTSFDLGDHHYVKIGKEFIDKNYPNRHTLILGDSNITVPEFINNNPNTKFDLIFIDGGHEYTTAINDIINCKNLAHSNTIVIMDDTIFVNKEFVANWNIGPTRAWTDAINSKYIISKGHEEYDLYRGNSWGKYNL